MARLADQPVAPSPRPDVPLARQQLATTLYRALDKLPDDQRAAFVLCEIDQLGAAEAGVIAGAPRPPCGRGCSTRARSCACSSTRRSPRELPP
jgi:DNA-directed RNA polymerase specialized sigma24 family protein